MKLASVASLLLVGNATSALAQRTTLPFDVYPGCERPQAANRQIVLDGSKGQTLMNAIKQNLVLPGDHVIVKGPQGALQMTRYSHPAWVGASLWTRIEGQGAVFTNIDLRNMSRFHLTNLKVTNTTGSLVALSGSSNVILSNSELFGAPDSSAWGVREWLAAPSGVSSDNSTCVSVYQNKLRNLRHGIFVSTRGTTVDTAVVNGLIKRNDLRNLSGDFLRPIGSRISVIGNKGYDGYLSAADGDANHDDFVQGYALNGVPYENVRISDNYFLESSSAARKFRADYQGISVFDGEYNNYVVSGNTLIGSAYHGIAMYGGNSGLIENNTVVSIFPGLNRKYWIHTPPTKSGVPASGIVVRNNFTNQVIMQPSGVSYSNNAVVAPPAVASHVVAFDLVNYRFDLHLRSSSVYAGKNIGDQTPE